jgi:hypothetical protein
LLELLSRLCLDNQATQESVGVEHRKYAPTTRLVEIPDSTLKIASLAQEREIE